MDASMNRSLDEWMEKERMDSWADVSMDGTNGRING